MFMDGIGIREAMHAIAERIANHGYYVLLPDLFYRAGPYIPPTPAALFGDPDVRAAWFSKISAVVTGDKVASDVSSFLAFLSAQRDVLQPKIGTTGYCMGGRLSLFAAGHFPERIAAAASYHGGNLATDSPESPHLLAPKMKARVYAAGAVEDPTFSDEQKQRLEDALTAAGVVHTIETYPNARHGWVPADTPVHDPGAAERHFATLFDLLDATLRKR
jgi:carboxymethylenebutenolidase